MQERHRSLYYTRVRWYASVDDGNHCTTRFLEKQRLGWGTMVKESLNFKPQWTFNHSDENYGSVGWYSSRLDDSPYINGINMEKKGASQV